MQGRQHTNANGYRYGMNTQEKDPEIFEGAYTAEFWEYDSRTGRRWNLDPVDQVSISNYATFANNPIKITDINGDVASDGDEKKGETTSTVSGSSSLKQMATIPASSNLNTSRGQINFSYSPQNYSQIGGTGNWKRQNDLSYVNPKDPAFDRFAPDETSGLMQLSITFLNYKSGNFSLSIRSGLGYGRIKGGIVNNDNPSQYDNKPHFGHGLGEIGPLGAVDFDLKLGRGLLLSGNFGITGGPSISDFGDDISPGKYDVSFLDSKYPNWSTRGYGGTGFAGVQLRIGSSILGMKRSRDIININLGYLFSIHSTKINGYTNYTTNQSYGSSTITTFGSGPVIGLTVDAAWRK